MTPQGEAFAKRLLAAKGMWPTPTASLTNYSESPESFQARAERLKASGVNGNGAGMPLTVAVKLWPTPTTTTDCKVSGAAAYSTESGRHAGVTLTDAAVRGLLAPQPPPAGERSSTAGRVLNPQFVEMLMGWPPNWTAVGRPPGPGWTACACAETESSPSRPPSPFESSGGS